MSKKLSPQSKRIRQKIMHRITRGARKAELHICDELDQYKDLVHEAVTSVLIEELED